MLLFFFHFEQQTSLLFQPYWKGNQIHMSMTKIGDLSMPKKGSWWKRVFVTAFFHVNFNFGVGSVSLPSVTSSQFLHLRQKCSRRVHRDCNSPLSSSLPALLMFPYCHILSFNTCQSEKGFSSQILAKGGINIVLSIQCVSRSCFPSRTSLTVNQNTWADFEQTHTVCFRAPTHTQKIIKMNRVFRLD